MKDSQIELVIYALFVSIVQGTADVWMIDSFVKCKKRKNFSNIILLLLVITHDFFISFFGGKDNYMLLCAEIIIFCSCILILFCMFYKGYAHWNFIYLLSFDGCFQLLGTVVSFPILITICHFDINQIELYMDKPGVVKAFSMAVLYFMIAKLTKYIMESLHKRRRRIFRIVCIIFAFMDISSILFLGWKIISIIFPMLFLFVIIVSWSQNHNDKNLENQFTYYRAREEIQIQKEKEISRIRHDIANHLSIMKEMEKDEEGRKLLKRIDKNYRVFTGIPVLDCLILDKERKCAEKQIKFTKQGICFSDTDISEYDLVSLFANLLDNAIEAAEQTEIPVVNLNVEKWQGYLKITITNSKPVSAVPLQNSFRTTKRDAGKHGLGNRIVKEIVENRDGRIQYEDEGNCMKVVVLMDLSLS